VPPAWDRQMRLQHPRQALRLVPERIETQGIELDRSIAAERKREAVLEHRREGEIAPLAGRPTAEVEPGEGREVIAVGDQRGQQAEPGQERCQPDLAASLLGAVEPQIGLLGGDQNAIGRRLADADGATQGHRRKAQIRLERMVDLQLGRKIADGRERQAGGDAPALAAE
jgi:hypothetical protein